MILQKLTHDFSICKIDDISRINFTREFVFLSKTDDEISLVCEADYVPSNINAVEHGFKALKITGMLDFGMVGVIAKIADILARKAISVFVVSTFNTDYILLKEENFERGIASLVSEGYTIVIECDK
ncbi:MAG: ACT domain-containing protein [Lachnospiraceae bacterium]|nr:ACT domain-containing protein [Lachnospiraceae bacterium]